MTDNVIPLGNVKIEDLHPQASRDEIAETVKRHNEEHLAVYQKAVSEDEVRSLITIALNYDGSVNWSISGQCSGFEVIAALERTKVDFMETE